MDHNAVYKSLLARRFRSRMILMSGFNVMTVDNKKKNILNIFAIANRRNGFDTKERYHYSYLNIVVFYIIYKK